MPRSNIFVVLMIAMVHFTVYTVSWGLAFGIGDGGNSVPAPLNLLVTVLGAPLMYLLMLPPSSFGLHWWGDDSKLIFILAGANSILWGVALTALLRLWQRHRTSA